MQIYNIINAPVNEVENTDVAVVVQGYKFISEERYKIIKENCADCMLNTCWGFMGILGFACLLFALYIITMILVLVFTFLYVGVDSTLKLFLGENEYNQLFNSCDFYKNYCNK